MKQNHKEKLRADLVKYGKQIGLLDNEIPELIFEPKQIDEIIKRYEDAGYNRRMHNKNLGYCHYPTRTIFVNAHTRGHYWVYARNAKGDYIERVDSLGQRWRKKIRKKVNYNSYKTTLVHELVHYRFHPLNHGAKFERRIKEILAGKEFPPGHTHLFDRLPKELEV